MTREAIILAGGKGTRLQSVVSDLPKPMAPVAGEPFLNHLLRRISAQGISRAILSVGYKRMAIEEYYGTRFQDLELVYAVEEKPLGTGGAIQSALHLTEEDRVFVLNGDTIADISLRSIDARQQECAGGLLTMALTAVADTMRYGSVQIDHGIVTRFHDKGVPGSGYINAGCYLIRRTLFDNYSLPTTFSFESDFLLPYLKELKPAAYQSDGYFIDIGIPEDYARAQVELKPVA